MLQVGMEPGNSESIFKGPFIADKLKEPLDYFTFYITAFAAAS